MGPQDRDVESLVAAGRLADAAAVCGAAGDHLRAADLFEQACDFRRAGEQALAGGDHGRAVLLAALAGDVPLQRRAVQAVLDRDEPELTERVGVDLSARGHPHAAALLFRGLGDFERAAEAFDRAGAPLEAAACYDRADKPAEAARLLEGVIRKGGASLASLEPSDDDGVDAARTALGRLYARHGRFEPAVRVLQQLPVESSHRPRALPSLALALERLGLRQALADLHPELRQHGIDPADVARLVHSEEAAREPPDEGRLYGRYDVIDEVATTPHARLVRATDSLTGQPVAVKVFASQLAGTGRDALQRFAREARALEQLRHPNVVRLYDFISEGPAMVLEWMEGGSLRELIDREPISPARAAEIGRALLAALAEAHRIGILHRDIKPSNLLFDTAGTPKLADFGAAHFSDSAATVTAGEIGSVAYMAPEQIRGQAATVQSDLYSTGVLLFEMLTGRRPEGRCAVSPHHPDLSEAHDALLSQLLAEEPRQRFEEAAAAQRAIESLPWPTRVVERAPQASSTASPAPEPERQGGRLGPPRQATHGPLTPWVRHDRWLGRDVIIVPLDEATRTRAAAFGRAGHPALPLVLRADPTAGEIWIDTPRGAALPGGQRLTDRERARLQQALEALHRAGSWHGAVDAAHVFRHEGDVWLAWPAAPDATGGPEDDLRRLARL